MSDIRVTKESIEAKIIDQEYFKLGETLTVCVLTLENGFTVTGESACIDPANYDQNTGRKIAYEEAFDKLWAFEGYLLKEKLYQEGKN